MKLRLAAILLLSIFPSALSLGQEINVPQEYLVKAKYLLNIPLFTKLPSQSGNSESYTICLTGDSPLESILMSSKGRMINNRPLEIRRLDDFSQIGKCQMLYIASSERHRLQTLLPNAHRQGTLTISDMRDFARLGGIISLLTVDNRVTFDLNRSAASKASISFSTNLLKLARDILN